MNNSKKLSLFRKGFSPGFRDYPVISTLGGTPLNVRQMKSLIGGTGGPSSGPAGMVTIVCQNGGPTGEGWSHTCNDSIYYPGTSTLIQESVDCRNHAHYWFGRPGCAVYWS